MCTTPPEVTWTASADNSIGTMDGHLPHDDQMSSSDEELMAEIQQHVSRRRSCCEMQQARRSTEQNNFNRMIARLQAAEEEAERRQQRESHLQQEDLSCDPLDTLSDRKTPSAKDWCESQVVEKDLALGTPRYSRDEALLLHRGPSCSGSVSGGGVASGKIARIDFSEELDDALWTEVLCFLPLFSTSKYDNAVAVSCRRVRSARISGQRERTVRSFAQNTRLTVQLAKAIELEVFRAYALGSPPSSPPLSMRTAAKSGLARSSAQATPNKRASLLRQPASEYRKVARRLLSNMRDGRLKAVSAPSSSSSSSSGRRSSSSSSSHRSSSSSRRSSSSSSSSSAVEAVPSAAGELLQQRRESNDLCTRVLRGDVLPYHLVRFSSEELASPARRAQRQEWRERGMQERRLENRLQKYKKNRCGTSLQWAPSSAALGEDAQRLESPTGMYYASSDWAALFQAAEQLHSKGDELKGIGAAQSEPAGAACGQPTTNGRIISKD